MWRDFSVNYEVDGNFYSSLAGAEQRAKELVKQKKEIIIKKNNVLYEAIFIKNGNVCCHKFKDFSK